MILYALLDEDSLHLHGYTITDFVKKARLMGAEIIQYRNKSGNIDKIESSLKEIKTLFDGKVIINDYPQLAFLCDGVHLGQEDIGAYGRCNTDAIKTVRNQIGKNQMIGLSTHNEREILEANLLDIDYVGLGAYRATSTKADAHILGKDILEKLAALSCHPVAAIGGVKPNDKIKNVAYLVVGSGIYED